MSCYSSVAFVCTAYHRIAARALTPDGPAANETPATNLASPAALLALPGGEPKPHQPEANALAAVQALDPSDMH